MRYAIYFTPGPGDPLTRAASAWLGRDAFDGQAISQPRIGVLDEPDRAAITSQPRRYGFHATLKAPFRLAADCTETELISALEGFAASTAAVNMPGIEIGNLDGFFALVSPEPNAALDIFAANVVRQFEPFRAPLTEAEISRRNPDRLSPALLDNLHKWGYPYVFDDFKFHMTLTNRIPEVDRDTVASAVEIAMAPVLKQPFVVDAVALFIQPAPGVPFLVHRHFKLGTSVTEKFVQNVR